MANWYGTCRSNYFHVKDVNNFKAMLDDYGAEFIEDREGRVGFLSCDHYGSIPSRFDGEEDEDVSILEELADHLAENEVCVVIETGAEKARYLTGLAIAIAWTGERTDLSLSQIYKQAQDEFGGDARITEAVY